VVSSLGEPAELWENTSPSANHWIIFKMLGGRSNRDGIGARIRMGNQWNQMTTAVSYGSSSDFGVHFGLARPNTLTRSKSAGRAAPSKCCKTSKRIKYWKSTNRKRSELRRRDLRFFFQLLFLSAIGLLQRLIFLESLFC